MASHRVVAALTAAGLVTAMLGTLPAAAQGSIQWSATNGVGSATLVYDRFVDGNYAPVTTQITNGAVSASALLRFVGNVPGDGALHTRTDSSSGDVLESGADVFLCDSCYAYTSFSGSRASGTVEISPDWIGVDSWFVGNYSYTRQANGLYGISGTTRYYRNGGSPYGGDAFFDSTFQFSNVQIAFAAVPEPASWLGLIGGFALAGAGLRSRRGRIARRAGGGPGYVPALPSFRTRTTGADSRTVPAGHTS